MPPTELSSLEDTFGHSRVSANGPDARTVSEGTSKKAHYRRSYNTLHFDALQSAVSKLSRIDDFDLEELGYGFFSDVFKVTHKQSGKVMVLKRNKNTNTKLNILREVQLMNRLSHPNILQFMGVCVHEGQLHALTEYINGGDLDQLVQRKSEYLSWKTRIKLAIDTSKGLQYLHNIGIFHRDLTAKNCLVRVTEVKGKKKYTAILADLGLAEKIPVTAEQRSRLKMVGTPYCMAPEVLCDKSYDERSDLFSFGLLMCQLAIRTSTEPEKLPRSNDFGLAKDLFVILVRQGVGCPEENLPDAQKTMPPSTYLQLAFDCCEVEPTNRPGIKDIVQRLEKVYNDEKSGPPVEKKVEEIASLPTLDKSPSNLSSIVLDTEATLTSNNESVNTELPINPPTVGPDCSAGTPVPPARSRSSRLSRSYSDISREWICHVMSMLNTPQKTLSESGNQLDLSSVLSTLNEAFMNPFASLEFQKPEIQEPKLFDMPSSEVLEMTFDLPPRKLSIESPTHAGHATALKQRRSCRPRSLVLEIPAAGTFGDMPELDASNLTFNASHKSLTPEPAVRIPSFLRQESLQSDQGSYPITPVSTPESPHISCGAKAHIPSCGFRQALLRSMALSPQGCRLLSWWHSQSRNANLESLSSVLAIMAEQVGGSQCSISMPDMSQNSEHPILNQRIVIPRRYSEFSEKSFAEKLVDQKSCLPNRTGYPSYATLPRKGKSRSKSDAYESRSRQGSRASDDVFNDTNFLEIVQEESTDSRAAQAFHPAAMQVMAPTWLENSQASNAAVAQDQGLSLGEGTDIHVDEHGHADVAGRMEESSAAQPIPPLVDGYGQVKTDGGISSSSSSSGTSSTGLQMTIQTGIISSSRRRRQGSIPCRPRVSSSPSSSRYRNVKSHPCQDAAAIRPSASPSRSLTSVLNPWNGKENTEVVTSPRNNRDSGYEEILSPEHSCNLQYCDSRRCKDIHNNNLHTCASHDPALLVSPSLNGSSGTYHHKVKDCNSNEAVFPLVSDSR